MKNRISLALLITGLILIFASTAMAQTKPKSYSGGPNLSQNYKLFGTMTDAVDPENPANEVISSTLDANNPDATFAGAFRLLKVKIAVLDNQVQLKYFFVTPRTCNGGSPRIQLSIDLDGDGVSDGHAFGYVGPAFSFTPCTAGEWKFEDLTDN